MNDYLQVALKLAVGIMALIMQMNLLGKANLAPSSSLDQLQNFVLGGIIGGVIYNNQISVLQFILVLIIWTFWVTLFKYLKENVGFVKRLIDGQPTTLIKNGEVLVDECTKKGISASDLMFKLRSANIYDTRQVKRAIQEQNGQLTIIQYGEESARFPLITNGFVNTDILDMLDKDTAWLEDEIKKQKEVISNVYLGEFINGNLVLSVYEKSTNGEV